MAQDTEKTQHVVGITKEDLAAVVAAAVTAARQPNVVEQQKIDAEAKAAQIELKDRLDNGQSLLIELSNKRATQRVCTHESPDPAGNLHTHAVYIQEKIGPGYILCQKNQCIIRPGQASPNYKGTVIYDTDQFNRLFQRCNTGNNLFM